MRLSEYVDAKNVPTREEIEKVASSYLNAHYTTLIYMLSAERACSPVIAGKWGYLLAHEAFHLRKDLRVAQ